GPISAVSAWARAVEGRVAPDDAGPVARYGSRELADLARSVRAMGVGLEARAGELEGYAAHVVHELRTPLTALKAGAELLGDGDLPPAETARLAARQAAHVDRLEALLRALQELGRAGAARRAPWRSVGRDARAAAAAAGLECRLEGDPQLPLSAEIAGAIFAQLARNAAEHGAKMVTVRAVPNGVTFADDGMGISLGNRGRIFDTFFTTRRENGGTGMGLAIVQRLIVAAGGRISLRDAENGASFSISFQ
ncbi:MAG: sensor histidine kinase, partial [Shimia sp.]